LPFLSNFCWKLSETCQVKNGISKSGTGNNGTGNNGTGNNGTGNNGTSGKVGKNGTFLIIGFKLGVWNGGFGFGNGGLSFLFKGLGFGEN